MVPEDMLTDTNQFAPLSPQNLPVSTQVVDRGVVESPEFDAVVVPLSHWCLQRLWTGFVESPEFALLSYLRICRLLRADSRHSTPGIPGIYGKCGPVGCRVTGVIELDVLPDVSQFTLLKPTGVAVVALVIAATVT